LAGSTAQLSETSSSGRGTDDVRNVNRNIGSSAGGDESSGHESKGSGNNQQSQSGGAQSGGAQDSDPAGHAAAQRAAELAETQHRETQRRDAERREAEQRVAQERERQQQEQRERESRTSRKRGRDADSQAEIETPEVDEDTASGMRRRKATIKARIAPNGQVMQAWVAQSSGSSSYDNLCLEKIKGGRYKAAIRDGKPVKTVITRTFALGQ
jgi:TonB family protein